MTAISIYDGLRTRTICSGRGWELARDIRLRFGPSSFLALGRMTSAFLRCCSSMLLEEDSGRNSISIELSSLSGMNVGLSMLFRSRCTPLVFGEASLEDVCVMKKIVKVMDWLRRADEYSPLEMRRVGERRQANGGGVKVRRRHCKRAGKDGRETNK